MKIRIYNKLAVTGLTETLRAEIYGKLTMVNPRWIENAKMNRFQGNTPKDLRFYQTAPDGESFNTWGGYSGRHRGRRQRG